MKTRQSTIADKESNSIIPIALLFQEPDFKIFEKRPNNEDYLFYMISILKPPKTIKFLGIREFDYIKNWLNILIFDTTMKYEKVYCMSFSKIYSLLVNKAVCKSRTKNEVDEIIYWLTGYKQEELNKLIESSVQYGDFFLKAPNPNENRVLIKGSICGVRVEEIEEPLMREIRYLDKLIDELAKGKLMNKILREE